MQAKNKKKELTEKELKVLLLICKQYSSPEIAAKLKISRRTIDGYRDSILKKTGSGNAVGIVLYAIKNKLIKL